LCGSASRFERCPPQRIGDAPGAARPVRLQNDLAGALQNRGIAKVDGGDLAGAIADFDAAIGLMEAIRDAPGAVRPVRLRNDLAGALQNRGTAKRRGGDLAGAIADYDAAIGLREAIRDAFGAAWPVPFQNELARGLQNRGTAKQDDGDLVGAIVDFDDAIVLMEAIRDALGAAWPVPLQNDLATVFQSRGIAKANGGDLVGAIGDFDAAIERMEAIRRQIGAALWDRDSGLAHTLRAAVMRILLSKPAKKAQQFSLLDSLIEAVRRAAGCAGTQSTFLHGRPLHFTVVSISRIQGSLRSGTWCNRASRPGMPCLTRAEPVPAICAYGKETAPAAAAMKARNAAR
jgi:tetratricopeptide (TPR) repeat protein